MKPSAREVATAFFLALGLLTYAGILYARYRWAWHKGREETIARLILGGAEKRREQMIREETNA